MDDKCDRRLIGRIASGDEGALAELYDAHAQTLYNFAARVLQSAEEAEEVVRGVFLSVRAGVPAWPDSASPAGAVLAGRVRDSVLGRIRGGSRRPPRDVDLWSIVSARESADPAVRAARQAIRNCGVVSTAVLTLVYFGGQTISDAAKKLSMTESECRSRLQVCLERLAGQPDGRGKPAPHGGKFLVNAAAWALGAITAIEEPGYSVHVTGGCPGCAEEISRYQAAAHLLPRLLPDVRLPADMFEKILFSVRLAGIAGAEPGAEPASARRPAPDGPGAASSTGENSHRKSAPAARDRRGHGSPRGGAGGWIGWAAAACAAGVIIALATYVRVLGSKLEEQSDLVESLQERHTDLLLRYDRLAGISGFFESKGVVTVLNGTREYPGLAGKIVWDTIGRSAMLQILNPPGEVANGRLRVTALGDDASVSLADFHGDDRDSGGVLYRFFPVDVEPTFPAGGFAVDLSPGTDGPEGEYHGLLRGGIAGRR